jgi:competence protein ComEC
MYHTLKTNASFMLLLKLFLYWEQRLQLERKNFILWVPVAIGVGIGCYFSLSFEPPLAMGISFVSLFLLTGFLCGKNYPHSLLIRWASMLLIFFGVGFLSAQIRVVVLSTPMLDESMSCDVAGTIAKVEELPEKTRISLENLNFYYPSIKKKLHKIRVSLRPSLKPDLLLLPGQKIRVKAYLMSPNGPVIPQGYDFRRKAYFESIGAVGFVTKIIFIEDSIKETRNLGIMKKTILKIAELRHCLTKKLKDDIQGMEGAIAAALVTGGRSSISDDIRQTFADAGIAHILAISGLHLSIVAGLVFLLFRRSFNFFPSISLSYPIKKWAAFLVIIFTYFYLVLCDFSLPAWRAFLMTAIIMVGIIFDRSAISLRNIALAAIFILIFLPESLLNISFQLSFAAVVSLVAVYEALKEKRESLQKKERKSKLLIYILGVCCTTVVATLATSPLIAYTFNRLTLQAISGNLIAIPLTSFVIMPLLVAMILFIPFHADFLIAPLLKYTLTFLIFIAQTVSSWPGASIVVPAIPSISLILFVLGSLWLCLWSKPWRFWGTVSIVAAFLVAYFSNPLPDIFIPQNQKFIAFRIDNALWVTSLRSGKYTHENLKQKWGVYEIKKITEKDHPPTIMLYEDMITFTKEEKTLFLKLAKKGHLLSSAGSLISYIASNEENFSSRTISLTTKDLEKKGGHYVGIKKGNIWIKSIRGESENRPWVEKSRILDDAAFKRFLT